MNRISLAARSLTVWLSVLIVAGAFAIGHSLTGGSRKWAGLVLVLVLFVFLRKWEEWVSVSMLFGVLILCGSATALTDLAREYRYHFFLLVVLTGAVRGLHEGFRGLGLCRYHLLQGLHVFTALLSTQWALHAPVSILRAFAFAVATAALWGTVWQYMSDLSRVERMLKVICLVVGGLFTATFLLLPVTSGAYVYGRLRGFMGNAGYLGSLACITLPLLWWFASRREPRRWKRAGWAALAAVTTIGLLMCAQRGSILALLVASLVYFLVNHPKLTVATLLLLAITGGFLWGYDVNLLEAGAVRTIVRPESLETGSSRLLLWETALRIFRHRPLLGHGWGNSDFLFYEYDESDLVATVGVEYAHNSLLDALLDLGLVGGVFFVLVVGYPFARGALAWWRSTDRAARRFLSLLLVAWLAIVISFQFNSGMFSFGSLWAFPMWVVALALTRAAIHLGPVTARAPAPVPAGTGSDLLGVPGLTARRMPRAAGGPP